jgi:L-alanine-DL-glutamate epimerase-like enolase superfamily enzyme
MMAISLIAAAALAAQAAQPAQPSAMVLAQAHDRCMTTYAVRLTRTSATDEAIYAEAIAGCKALKDQLSASIAREYSPAQAAELTGTLETQARPNFLTLLQRIRTDRLSRGGN